MKLIDKYILLNILTPFVYCLMAFMMLFVIFDLFSNFSDFIEANIALRQALRFYLYLVPSVLIFIVPISLLLAILYGLSQLTRNNELTAMRASGVSLYRLMVPIISIGLLASLLVSFVNETMAPWSAYWTHQFVQAQRHDGDDSFYITPNLPFKNPHARRDWIIGEFDRQTFDMSRVEVFQENDDRSGGLRIRATAARWLDGKWWFIEANIQELDDRSYPIGMPRTVARMPMTDFDETPRDFINVTKDPQFLSSRELITYIQAHQHLSTDTLARYTVDLHYRLAMPWTSLIVTLLGLPLGAHTGRKGAMGGIAITLGMFFSFYVLINLGMALGKKQIIAPGLAVWLPNLIYLIIGIVLVRRMR